MTATCGGGEESLIYQEFLLSRDLAAEALLALSVLSVFKNKKFLPTSSYSFDKRENFLNLPLALYRIQLLGELPTMECFANNFG